MLWALDEPEKLSEVTRDAIEAERNEVFVSVVSPWEVAIKQALNRLEAPDGLEEVLQRQRFELLPVLMRHTKAVASMPHHHRDPFDRMLIAQAMTDGMTLVTDDRDVARYQVSLLPAS
jgi:PIN domain nuclease of toxin-antitoxin system